MSPQNKSSSCQPLHSSLICYSSLLATTKSIALFVWSRWACCARRSQRLYMFSLVASPSFLCASSWGSWSETMSISNIDARKFISRMVVFIFVSSLCRLFSCSFMFCLGSFSMLLESACNIRNKNISEQKWTKQKLVTTLDRFILLKFMVKHFRVGSFSREQWKWL